MVRPKSDRLAVPEGRARTDELNASGARHHGDRKRVLSCSKRPLRNRSSNSLPEFAHLESGRSCRCEADLRHDQQGSEPETATSSGIRRPRLLNSRRRRWRSCRCPDDGVGQSVAFDVVADRTGDRVRIALSRSGRSSGTPARLQHLPECFEPQFDGWPEYVWDDDHRTFRFSAQMCLA